MARPCAITANSRFKHVVDRISDKKVQKEGECSTRIEAYYRKAVIRESGKKPDMNQGPRNVRTL